MYGYKTHMINYAKGILSTPVAKLRKGATTKLETNIYE